MNKVACITTFMLLSLNADAQSVVASPVYKARFGNVTGHTMTIQQAYDNSKIGLVVLPEERGCEVVIYEVGALPARGDLIGPMLVKGKVLALGTQKYQGLTPRHAVKYMFEKIVAKCPGGKMVKVRPFSVFVSDEIK